MKYSEKFVKYLKTEINFIQVIMDEIEGVKVKKSGQDYLIQCPFHREKNLSFRIFYRFWIAPYFLFHCFGCSLSGDVITFIMRRHNIDFLSAVKYLIKKYDI